MAWRDYGLGIPDRQKEEKRSPTYESDVPVVTLSDRISYLKSERSDEQTFTWLPYPDANTRDRRFLLRRLTSD